MGLRKSLLIADAGFDYKTSLSVFPTGLDRGFGRESLGRK